MGGKIARVFCSIFTLQKISAGTDHEVKRALIKGGRPTIKRLGFKKHVHNSFLYGSADILDVLKKRKEKRRGDFFSFWYHTYLMHVRYSFPLRSAERKKNSRIRTGRFEFLYCKKYARNSVKLFEPTVYNFS